MTLLDLRHGGGGGLSVLPVLRSLARAGFGAGPAGAEGRVPNPDNFTMPTRDGFYELHDVVR